MKIGYPCINTTMNCSSSQTFRLKHYSEKRLRETVESNLACLRRILRFNLKHDILFFRITSDLIPFASHPICLFDWRRHFEVQFKRIGNLIRSQEMRISMHPGQFTLINSPNEGVFERSKRELEYHAQVLNLMELDSSAKIQIHVGGIYGDKDRSLTRFINRFEMLDANVKDRLVIENDDRRYTLRDCLHLNAETGVPVLFDLFHHEINCSGENLQEALKLLAATWKAKDGILMVDYSMQKAGHKIGTHADTVNSSLFKDLLVKSKPYDFDVMLEIKDKELSALKAIEIARKDDRFLAAVHTDKTLRNP